MEKYKLKDIQTGPGDEHHRRTYGEQVRVTRLGWINIVHPDNPSQETIRRRIEEVIHEEIEGNPFEADCPLCQDMMSQPYDVVYTGKTSQD